MIKWVKIYTIYNMYDIIEIVQKGNTTTYGELSGYPERG